MYESIFLNGCGSNIFTSLGALDKLRNKLENVRIWNVCGNSSLILYFKIIGMTSKQTFDVLKDFNIINTFINGHSLFPENEEEKTEYIKNFLEKFLLKKQTLFKTDTTLEEVEKITGITPCFIVWNRTDKRIDNLNPNDTPNLKLLDCIMATLTNIGVFNSYKIKSTEYSSLENIESFPVAFSYCIDPSTLFYLINVTEFIKGYSKGLNLGPLKDVEDEFLLQKSEYNKYHIEKNYKFLPHQENVCKLYSTFSRGNSKEEEKNSLYFLGLRQADGYLENKDTLKVYKEYLQDIFLQN
jgi:hypothetical protein